VHVAEPLILLSLATSHVHGQEGHGREGEDKEKGLACGDVEERGGSGPGAKARRGGATPRRFPLGAVTDPTGSGGSPPGSVERRWTPPRGGGGQRWIPPGGGGARRRIPPGRTARQRCPTAEGRGEAGRHQGGSSATSVSSTRQPLLPPRQHGSEAGAAGGRDCHHGSAGRWCRR